MANLIWPVVLGLIIAGCNSPPARSTTVAGSGGDAGYCVSGELVCRSGEVAYEVDGRTLRPGGGGSFRPYQVVCLGAVPLVTTVDEGLQFSTWAAGAQPVEYPGLLPEVVQPPVRALTALPDLDEAMAFRSVLLDRSGGIAWAADGAQLLWPAAAVAGPPVTAYYAVAAGVDPEMDLVLPYGDRPRLLAVDPLTGSESWTADLAALAPVADVELGALGRTHGLLILQYSFYAYELVVFDRAAGRLTARHKLAGMPVSRVVYPGAFDEHGLLELSGDTAVLLVYLADSSVERWRIELGTGGLERDAAEPSGRAVREENELPTGGTGAPGPGAAAFVQAVLPTAAGTDWRIPALVDTGGRVLVIDAEGARWAALDAQAP